MMSAQAFIRVDASPRIGGGHLSRCLALADSLVARGARVRFLCAPLAKDQEEQVRQAGFELTTLTAPEEDERAYANAVATGHSRPAVLIVDHYELDAGWETRWRSLVDRIVVIDDLANRPHDCDVLVDQAYGADASRYAGLVPARCVGLFGTRYALLRPDFARWRDRLMRAPELRRQGAVHVFFGSEDRRGHTLRFARLLTILAPAVEVRVAVSPRFADTAGLEESRRASHGRLSWEVVGARMAEHMAGCDVAVGSPGQTTWERACLGLPALYVAVSDNQIPILERLAAAGFCAYLDSDRQLSDAAFTAGCMRFLADLPAQRRMRELSLAAVDGLGSGRVAERALGGLA